MQNNLFSSLSGSRTYLVGILSIAAAAAGELSQGLGHGQSLQMALIGVGLITLRQALDNYHLVLHSALAQHFGMLVGPIVEGIISRAVNAALQDYQAQAAAKSINFSELVPKPFRPAYVPTPIPETATPVAIPADLQEAMSRMLLCGHVDAAKAVISASPTL